MFDSFKIYTGQAIDLEETYKTLTQLGYKRVSGISVEGDFSVKGESIYIFPNTFEYPLRIELENSTVHALRSIDLLSYRSISSHNMCMIIPIKGMLRKRRYSPRMAKGSHPIDSFVDIEPSDYVVHIEYGIGRYLGLERVETKSGPEDHMVIEYKGNDRVFVPFEDLNKVQKYISFTKRPARLHKIGSRTWLRMKEKAKKGATRVAIDILDMQAKRKMLLGFSYSPDTDWQSKLEASFPYKETNDQIKVTDEVKRDMERAVPMDRLLCGDVGYGKTEVALRATFKAVMDNKQVAILVPTTILAEQHYTTFSKRMRDFPVNIEILCRFKTKAEQGSIIESLMAGSVDIIIGTHRLLSGDVAFKDLGLVIIDEEQRFGVNHKEKLKRLRLVVDVLTLTATPIPRTLYLTLMGGRDISVIDTPPLERQPVKTLIARFDNNVVKEAIQNEIDRKGQVFFINNRILGIEKICQRLRRMFPELRIEIAHGRMREKDLEKIMGDFIRGQIDVLVCTTIIESGIDIPNANTILINNADTFGLADLYQLRGRVGRFSKRAFCYLLVDNIETLTGDVQKRLHTIKRYQELGSGFKIAMQDLELRGTGNLLGTEQSGHIESVGFDLYCRLLKNAIETLTTDEGK
ncbi:MAG: transcription-repair coupling factor [Candidatus Omnitrophota bacterium]